MDPREFDPREVDFGSPQAPLTRSGRRRITAERIPSREIDPSVTMIEANRSDGAFRPVDGDAEASEVKSARRVLRIFEYFEEIQRPAPMTEIARRLNYPTSSAAALLKCLVGLGYLHYDREARTYIPHMRISLLGGWVHDRMFPEGSLARLTRDLNQATSLTVFVVMRNGLYAQYVQVLQGKTSIRYYLEPGGFRLLPFSTPGRVLLSLMSDGEAQRIVRRITAERSSPTRCASFAELAPALETIRRQGFAYTRNLGTPGLATLAMRLTPIGREPALAIGAAGSCEHVVPNVGAIIARMRELIGEQAPSVLPAFAPDAGIAET
ncbi:transcriptional regulator, IclR family [Rhizobiales bacterium GAS191]|nr:transcriptional regulator, IclR family [Rhizobiales bacterium GAS191]